MCQCVSHPYHLKHCGGEIEITSKDEKTIINLLQTVMQKSLYGEEIKSGLILGEEPEM